MKFEIDWVDRADRRKHSLTLDYASYRVSNRVLLKHEDIVKAAKTFDTTTGIYFLIREDKVVYVGQSVNIFARVQSHKTSDRKKFDRWAFVQCESHQLDALESLYIMALEPEDNGKNTNKKFAMPLTLDRILLSISKDPDASIPESQKQSWERIKLRREKQAQIDMELRRGSYGT